MSYPELTCSKIILPAYPDKTGHDLT